jgi:L-amino acid N-acyltransferase YncA
MIRTATQQDAEIVAAIYNEYVANSHVTFEEKIVSQQTMASRINDVQNLNLPWLVAVEDNNYVVGYAYASPWKLRSAYRHSVEITVYLAQHIQSKGWGTLLYQRLFAQLKDCNIHLVIAGIALPNSASIALHEKFKMEKVGQFKQVGRKFENWIDVGYWQVILQ